jgi:surface antigen
MKLPEKTWVKKVQKNRGHIEEQNACSNKIVKNHAFSSENGHFFQTALCS